jgi:pimeloyl-ACP methyl ester carboxylesterase
MRNLLAKEAAAYLRAGWLAPTGGRLVLSNEEKASFGVLFVPGVAANVSQFMPIKRAIEEEVEWFDAFEYSSLTHPARIAEALRDHLDRIRTRCDRVVAIGHSLGGLLLRIALQAERPPPSVVGFVSICAPLHGTWLSRLALNPALRALAPDGKLMSEILANAHRLDRLRGAVLTVGVELDTFVSPAESAFLDGHEQLALDDAGHVSALFDARVSDAVRALVRRLKPSD